jgi:hypothetical protein
LHKFAQGVTVNELHHYEVMSLAFADLVNVRDVWMIESGGSLRFSLESM